MLSQLVQVPALHRVCAPLCVGIHFRNFQAAAGRISVVAAAGINADCAADVVHACTPQSLQLPVAAPVWIHMSGSGLSPTAADPICRIFPRPAPAACAAAAGCDAGLLLCAAFKLTFSAGASAEGALWVQRRRTHSEG